MVRGTSLDLMGLATALVVFAALGLYQLTLPGMYQDEALMIAPTARWVLGTGGWPYSLLPQSLDLPLMANDHVGPTEPYLMVPFLATLGVGELAPRVYQFCVGLATLVLVFLWGGRVVPRGMRWLPPMLLAVSPSFWLACRNGTYISFLVATLAAGALLALDSWSRTRRRRFLTAGCFLLGLGLTTKILFLWLMAALAVGLALMGRTIWRRLGRRELAVGAVSFAIGSSPLLLFNVLSRGQTLRTILERMRETPQGVENAALIENLWTQVVAFGRLLDGGWLLWAGDSPRNGAAVAAFGLAVTYLVVRWVDPGWRRARFCVVAVAVMVAASSFTISVLGTLHLVMLLVFPSVIVAAGTAMAWENRGRIGPRVVLSLLSALVLAQFGWDAVNSIRYHRALRETRGVGLFSSAHNELARYLAERGVKKPLAGDWGFEWNLEVVSGGRVRPQSVVELYEAAPFAFTREQVRVMLEDPGAVYLFHAEEIAIAKGRRAAVEEVAEEMGVRLDVEKTFRDGLGRPVILVIRARR